MTSDSSPEIASLRAKMRSVESAVSDLRQQLRAVDELARKQEAMQESLASLEEMYKRDRTAQAAYNELTVLQRQRQARFGRFEEARNMAASIIDVVASGHINRAVILDVTERLAIQTPRYWVAQAALAAAAWLGDNPQQYREAIDCALTLDYEKTSLFMALLLRDQHRDQELQEWLTVYLSRLTPVNLPRHFQVVIDAATGNALGGHSAPQLVRQVSEWYADERGRQDISDTAAGEWKRRLLRLGARHGGPPGFPLLAASETAWKVLSPRYEASRAIEQAARYFRERFQTGATVSDDVRGELAVLLGKLARTEDPEEEEILAAIRENRAITQAKGDLSAARAMVAADDQARRSTLNIVSMVSQSAFPEPADGQLPAPTVTELLAIMLSKDLIVTAAHELRQDLPAAGTIVLTVGKRQWECRFACGDAEQRTGPALRAQAQEQARKICAQIQREADRRQGLRRWLRRWACPSGLTAGVGLGGAAFIPSAPPELMAAALLAGVPSILGLIRLPRAVRRATDQAEQEKRAVTGQIMAAAEQLAGLWEADRRSAGADLPGLRGYLLGLTRDDLIAATRPLAAVTLPRTREFPPWTPRPPMLHPAIEAEDDLLPLETA